MKRILILISAGFIILLFGVWFALRILIGQNVKENILVAKQKYSGTAEDALISFLHDESNSAYDRTHTAIWTLGQIHSEKALPILYEYYENDPKGETCFGKHDTRLCQSKIHTAIVVIERGRLFSHARLNK